MVTNKGKGQSKNVPWPAVTYEKLVWTPSEGFDLPRRERLRQQGEYLAAVTPKISKLDAIQISTSVTAAADEASAEIARFDAEVGGRLGPFASLLLRSESASSSKIENLTASAKAIALAELGDPSKRNAREVVANTTAMKSAIDLADNLDPASILAMHDALMRETAPDWAGRWRAEPVWIGGSDYGPIGAVFVPPVHGRIVPAIEDLVDFLKRDDLPVLMQVTIAHAQFETIHPFPDGNGRTGRALLQASLRAKGLTRNVTVPISGGLLTDTQRYFDALTAYRQGDIETLIEMMADASFRAVVNGRRLVEDLDEINGNWQESIKARQGATAWALADLLFRQPIVDSPLVQSELGVSAPTANEAIKTLEEANILVEVSGNYRNRKWAAPELLRSLDAFATRAGRRK